ncbi:glycine betaine ABC transporter substrate-binding protein [Cellulomonas sp. PhB143]|uniref:glycine betaine ABC transporter substrate-binding protein n=1 Tax=Cellulomonas sp. PhB143 TaxID=2485186 RepID=UPI000F49A5CA|nr:glycine betaine ABC transporter substrate-binding protein [Cellulomonas sp. PhB143]ROS77026.1 osmoprotectant transport system substrate-binding protein [Cellulomonas sp. PhB143]
MRINRTSGLRSVAAAAALVALLAACGQSGSSGTGGSTSAASGAASDDGSAPPTCEPVPGDQLVVLDDDKHLQTVDNIVPAVNAAAAEGDDALLSLLSSVSEALDTDKLIALNKAVDVDRKTSADVATQFVEDEGLAAKDAPGKGKSVVVGAGNFSESSTLAAIYADVLKSAGYTTKVQTIGNRETYYPALTAGDLTVVPEYVGTLTEFINKKENGADAKPMASADLDATMDALTSLGEKVGLAFGTPSPAQDQNAFAVTTGFAEANDLTTLSDLAATCGGVVLGGPPECAERSFCQPGLEETYGLDVASFQSLDAGGPLTKKALQQGKATVGLVFSSDGQLTTGG